jgi:hypothetical protein
MKTQSNFRIKHRKAFNDHGIPFNEYYYIQELKKFLWWPYWKDIEQTACGSYECYKTTITFGTLEEAQLFVREVLCPELPRGGSIEKVVDEISCK